MRRVSSFEVAGVRLDVSAEGPAAALVAALGEVYPVRGAAGTLDVELFSSGADDGSEGTIEVVELGQATRIGMGQGLSGRVDLETRKAVLCAADAEASIRSALRFAFAVVALRSGVLWLHSLGVVREGRGYVFPGRSGSGKSTLGQTIAPEELLADESVAVRWDQGRPWVCTTPFQSAGHAPPPHRQGPLGGLLFLSRGAHTTTRPLEPVQALARLWTCIFSRERSPAAQRRALTLAVELVSAVPASELCFRLEPGVIDKAICDHENRKMLAS